MNMRSFRAALSAVSLAFWAAAITPSFAENSWTKTTSGNWEKPFWSAGHLPSFTDGAILFTNAGWKALAIGSATTANYPDSLRINSLTVDAPVDSHNLLLLNWAQLSLPLQADSLLVGTNGSLDSHYSALDAGIFTVNGQASFADFGQSRFGTVNVGLAGPAQLNLSNGWFAANELIITGGAGSTFNQSGGSNQVSGRMLIDSWGFYNLSGGDFKAASIDLFSTTPRYGRPVERPTAARLNVNGGRAEVERQLTLGGFNGYDWQPGVMEITAGFFKGGDLLVTQGLANQTGGTNQLTQLSLSPGEYDTVDYVLYDGRLESARVYLGYPSSALGFFSKGVFTQSGGVHSNSQSIMASGVPIGSDEVFTGTYSLAAGTLLSPGIGLDGGKFDQSGGTNYAMEAVTSCPAAH